MFEYRIIKSCDKIDFNQVSEILNYYGLSDLDASTQKKIFENSYAVVFLIKNEYLIGLGRAISDGISQAAIYNIAVREEYHGKGLGKIIVDELIKQVEGCNVILYTHPKHIGLYEHWGFARLNTGYIKFNDESHYREEGFIS